jgi:hypothetical protein
VIFRFSSTSPSIFESAGQIKIDLHTKKKSKYRKRFTKTEKKIQSSFPDVVDLTMTVTEFGCNMMRPMPFTGYPFQGKIENT